MDKCKYLHRLCKCFQKYFLLGALWWPHSSRAMGLDPLPKPSVCIMSNGAICDRPASHPRCPLLQTHCDRISREYNTDFSAASKKSIFAKVMEL